MVTVTARRCRLEALAIVGPTEGSCLLLDGTGVDDCVLQDVSLNGSLAYGLRARNIRSAALVNSEANENQLGGMRFERTVSAMPWNIRCVSGGCRKNGGPGYIIDVPAGLSDEGDAVVLLGCTMESNSPAGATQGNGLEVRGARGVSAIGCYFERPPDPVEPPVYPLPNPGVQFIYAEGADAVVVEGCYFQATSKMHRAATFVDCAGARFTSNTAFNLLDITAGRRAVVVAFDPDCVDAVEFGNRQRPTPDSPRVLIEGLRVFGLSRGVVQVYRHQQAPQSTTEYLPGAMVWVEEEKALRVFVSATAGWRKVKFAA